MCLLISQKNSYSFDIDWWMGQIQDFRDGGSRYGLLKAVTCSAVPCRGLGKISKTEFFENGISSILLCVINNVSYFIIEGV